MKKENQSLIDFISTTPLASFLMRSPMSSDDAQIVYKIWSYGQEDEYGKYVIPTDIDPLKIASLTSKGYIRNVPSRLATVGKMPVRTCEFTDLSKNLIKKLILHKEESAFEKSASNAKTASVKEKNNNWLQRVFHGSCA